MASSAAWSGGSARAPAGQAATATASSGTSSPVSDTHPDGTASYQRAWVEVNDGMAAYPTKEYSGKRKNVVKAAQLFTAAGLAKPPVIRVFQWNVLADTLAKGSDDEHESYDAEGAGELPGCRWVGWGPSGPPPDYQHQHVFRCSQQWLAWDHRGSKIVQEIRRHAPDVIALQEVDRWDYFKEGLEGYDGAFAAKTGYDDGVALLWRNDWGRAAGRVFRFTRGAQVGLAVRLLIPATIMTDSEEGDGEWEGAADQKAPSSELHEIVVVTMHLKAGYNSQFEATREHQVRGIISAIEAFAHDVPVVLLADLNAHPTDLSDLPARAIPALRRKGFRSAYPPDAFTVWSGWTDGEVRAAFDHVLYTERDIKCKRVYELPLTSSVRREPCRLPNHRWPSDHLPLVADLEVRVPPRPPRNSDCRGGSDSVVIDTAHLHHPLPYYPPPPPTTTTPAGLSLCRFWASGTCHYSQMCKFPHSDGRRGERCYFYDNGQHCRHGDSCHFLHSSTSSAPMAVQGHEAGMHMHAHGGGAHRHGHGSHLDHHAHAHQYHNHGRHGHGGHVPEHHAHRHGGQRMANHHHHHPHPHNHGGRLGHPVHGEMYPMY